MAPTCRIVLALVASFTMATGTASAQTAAGRHLTANMIAPGGDVGGTATFNVNVGLNQICYKITISGIGPSHLVSLTRLGVGVIFEYPSAAGCPPSAWNDGELQNLIMHPEEYTVVAEDAFHSWEGQLEK